MTYQIPVFDYDTYLKVQARIKYLSNSKSVRLCYSLDRAKALKKRMINRFISDLAIYHVVSGQDIVEYDENIKNIGNNIKLNYEKLRNYTD